MNKIFTTSTQISYLEASINYTIFHFQDGHKEIHAYTLKKYEKAFQNNLVFSRIHRRFLVNRHFIVSNSETEVLLSCGKILPVARRRSV